MRHHQRAFASMCAPTVALTVIQRVSRVTTRHVGDHAHTSCDRWRCRPLWSHARSSDRSCPCNHASHCRMPRAHLERSVSRKAAGTIERSCGGAPHTRQRCLPRRCCPRRALRRAQHGRHSVHERPRGCREARMMMTVVGLAGPTPAAAPAVASRRLVLSPRVRVLSGAAAPWCRHSVSPALRGATTWWRASRGSQSTRWRSAPSWRRR